MKILETRDLKKYYGKGDTQVKALDGVNLSIEEGEFTAVVGTSGSGKSTLLHMLGGLDYATGGTVTVAGKKIFELGENDLTIFRRRQIGDNLPGQLSGGQQQRVAIARALITKPAIILADEPTGNLDSKTTQEVLGLLKLTGEQFHQTIVMITHNEALAQLCDRVIHIEDGRIADDREVRS
ncbi:MAG: ABC transporter ATP-binding protein [Lachnospiraceae bacterium]|nr:ABC transporter ATP-binding protein [Lachnospiraceae bacterium]